MYIVEELEGSGNVSVVKIIQWLTKLAYMYIYYLTVSTSISTNVATEWLAILLRNPKIPGLNIHQKTCCRAGDPSKG
jgi:hypothetical protein